MESVISVFVEHFMQQSFNSKIVLLINLLENEEFTRVLVSAHPDEEDEVLEFLNWLVDEVKEKLDLESDE